MVTVAHSLLGSRLCRAALGRPVSCRPWSGWVGRKKGREGTREEEKGTEGGKGAHTLPACLTQSRPSGPYL